MKKKFVLGLILLFSTLIYAQISIAVLDLEGKGLTELEASILTDRLRHELFQTGRYRVIERDMMGEIIDEQGFQLSECTSTECMVEIGRILGVDQMVGGSVSKFGSMYSISVRLISVETGEILGTATYDHEGKIEDLLKYGMRVVSNELSGMKDEESIVQTDIDTVYQEPVKQPEPQERVIVAQEQIKDVQKQPVTQPAPLPQKAVQSFQKSVTKKKTPTIMLRSEFGVYGLTNQDRKDNYDGTAGPLFGVSAIYNILNLQEIGVIGLLAGFQSMILVLSPKESDSRWDVRDVQENYIVTKAGLQAASVSQSKLNVTASIGYASVSTSTIFVDEWDNRSDSIQESAGGIFADLIFSFRPLDAINITLDGGYGTLVAGKDNFYGGNKFMIGGSLNF